MKNEELIFKYNSKSFSKRLKNINVLNGCIFVNIYDDELNNSTVKNIASYVSYINGRYKNTKLTVVFDFKHIKLLDKLSFVILECIIKSLITQYNHKVEIVLNIEKIILTEGILSSPLLILANPKKRVLEKNIKFLEKFKDDYYQYHFRRVLKYEECFNTDKLCKLYDDLAYFQNYFNINYDCREDISEVIIELIGNAIEHSKSDCLVDFDIAPNYINEKGEAVCGINIAILNFSELLLGDELDRSITSFAMSEEFSEKYVKVQEAFDNHSGFFDDSYDRKDFFNISVFQNKVSSRGDNRSTGGTGLTKLIKSIEDRADDHSCYVLTGDRLIVFDKNYLEYDGDWIGFNSENDYFNHRPYYGLLERSNFYMPGTAYNLNFIMKVNESDG